MRIFLGLLFLKLSIFFCNVAFAIIPQQILDHLDREESQLQALPKIELNPQQNTLVINSYVENLVSRYQIREEISLADDAKKTLTSLVGDKIRKRIPNLDKGNIRECYPLTTPIDISSLDKFLTKEWRTKKEARLCFNFQGYNIPLNATYSYSDNKTRYLSVLGILKDSNTRHTPYCLNLALHSSNEATLDRFASAYAACPIPLEKPGTFLLALAEELARSFGKQFISLVDASEIRCRKNDKEVSLSRLSIFQRGQTWYASKGFMSSKDQQDNSNEIQNFSLDKLEGEVNDLFKNYLATKKTLKYVDAETILLEEKRLKKWKPHFDKAIRDFRIQPDQHALLTVGQFFSWLWQRDCVMYRSLEKLIFGNQFLSSLSIRELRYPYDYKKSL